MAEDLAVVTAAAPNYMAQTRVMAASLRRFHPDVPLYVLLAAPRQPAQALHRLGPRVLGLEDLRVEGLASLLLRYDCKELCASLKPWLLRMALDCGHRTAVFLDPDMLVLETLAPVFEQASRHALALTPHLLPGSAMAPDEHLERALLMAGMFNGGLVAASDCAEARRFLDWWAQRLRTHCIEEVREGFHFDQRWLDLAPGFVSDLILLRDPGVNAAYWRLPWLRLERRGEAFFAQGAPLRLFHFSGYDPRRPDQATRFRPGWSIEDAGEAADLFRLYQRLLIEEGWSEDATAEYRLPETFQILRFARRARGVLRRTAQRMRRSWQAR